MSRKTKKNESLAALLVQTVVAKADVAQLKARIHVREHKKAYTRGAIAAGAAAAIAALVEVA